MHTFFSHSYFHSILRLTFAIGVCLLFMSGQPVFAFGISPVIIDVSDVLIGTETTQSLYLVRGQTQREDIVTASVSGTGSSAISVPQEIILPIGKEQIEVPVLIDASLLSPQKTYAAVLNFSIKTSSDTSSIQEQTILPGVTAQVRFSTTDQRIADFEIKQVILPSYKSSESGSFHFVLVNKGNVPIAPKSIHWEFVAQNDPTIHFNSTLIPSESERVDAFATTTRIMPLNVDIPTGVYLGTATFFDENDHLVHTTDPMFLQVAGHVSTSGLSRFLLPALWCLLFVALAGVVWVANKRTNLSI